VVVVVAPLLRSVLQMNVDGEIRYTPHFEEFCFLNEYRDLKGFIGSEMAIVCAQGCMRLTGSLAPAASRRRARSVRGLAVLPTQSVPPNQTKSFLRKSNGAMRCDMLV